MKYVCHIPSFFVVVDPASIYCLSLHDCMYLKRFLQLLAGAGVRFLTHARKTWQQSFTISQRHFSFLPCEPVEKCISAALPSIVLHWSLSGCLLHVPLTETSKNCVNPRTVSGRHSHTECLLVVAVKDRVSSFFSVVQIFTLFIHLSCVGRTSPLCR